MALKAKLALSIFAAFVFLPLFFRTCLAFPSEEEESSFSEEEEKDDVTGYLNLCVGVVLFLTSSSLAECVPLYYLFGAIFGVFLPTIIGMVQCIKILYQSIFGVPLTIAFLVGLGSVVHSFFALLNFIIDFDFFEKLGFNEEIQVSLQILLLLSLLYLYCGLGVWVIKNWVLTPIGSVGPFLSSFINRLIRIVAIGFLGKSSGDIIFRVTAVTFGFGILFCIEIIQFLKNRRRRRERALVEQKEGREDNLSSWRLSHCNFELEEKGDSRNWVEEIHVSSFHWKPNNSPKKSENEINSINKRCTKGALRQLFSSPEFSDWKEMRSKNSQGENPREERTFKEIQETAFL